MFFLINFLNSFANLDHLLLAHFPFYVQDFVYCFNLPQLLTDRSRLIFAVAYQFDFSYFEGGFSKFEKKYSTFCEPGEDVERPLLSLSGLTIQDSEQEHRPLRVIEPATPQITDHQESRTKVPVQILPHLYLGSEKDSSDLEILKKYGISYILNVTHDKPNSFEHLPGFKYKKLPVEDNWRANLSDMFPEAFEFIGM